MDNQFFHGHVPYGQDQHLCSRHQPSPQHQQQQSCTSTSYGGLSATQDQLQYLQQQSSQEEGLSQCASQLRADPGSQDHIPTTPYLLAGLTTGKGQTNPQVYVSPARAMEPPLYLNDPHTISSYEMHGFSTTASMLHSISSKVACPVIPGEASVSTGGMHSFHNHQMCHGPSFAQKKEATMYTVSSQGRRGIPPSAISKPKTLPINSGQLAEVRVPQKDSDGRYPCIYCEKTYQHPRLLKRHILRRESLSGQNFGWTNSEQTLVIAHTSATCAKTLSRVATSSNAISKNV